MDIPTPIIAGLTREDGDWLAREATPQRVDVGTALARVGKAANGLFLVKNALLARVTPALIMPQHEFGLDGPGSIAMPFAVLGDGQSPWDLVVRKAGQVLHLAPRSFAGMPRNVRKTIEAAAVEQAAALARHTAMFAKRSARTLVAVRLQDYFTALGEKRMAITHDQLAERMSLRRATVTIALQELEGLHAIRARRGSVELTDPGLLAGLAGGSA
jgi:hypothetical protein